MTEVTLCVPPSTLRIPGQFLASSQGHRTLGVRARYVTHMHTKWLMWFFGPWVIGPIFVGPHSPLWSNTSGPRIGIYGVGSFGPSWALELKVMDFGLKLTMDWTLGEKAH